MTDPVAEAERLLSLADKFISERNDESWMAFDDACDPWAIKAILKSFLSTAAECERLRKDAERYRWARKHDVLMWRHGLDRRAPFECSTGLALDVNIDAAKESNGR